MKKVFIVTDLGPGDGGKGGVVHKICREMGSHTVVKKGGAQGNHGVRTSRGESFNFSHFGCGTFEGVRTHISSQMVIDPIGLVHEGELLKYQHGVRDVFELITVEEDVLCSTPFHLIASRLRELARKNNPKGTVGLGIGEALLDSETQPGLAIKVKDLGKKDLRDKLQAVRLQKLDSLAEIIAGPFWDSDREVAMEHIANLRNPAFVDSIVASFQDTRSLVTIVSREYLKDNVFSRDCVVVFESSHGVLTDRYYGFHPHTTKLRTVPASALNLLKECEYEGEVMKLGVTRAYQVRHGAGPMVTEDPLMAMYLLPGSNKEENRWQGKVRVGPLDLVALRYAINVCGGPQEFDGLAVTWFDQIEASREWRVCDRYTDTGNLKFFSEEREIKVRHGSGTDQLEYQERLGKILRGCQPYLTSYTVSGDASKEDLTNLCGEVVEAKLRVPLAMISFGPTEDDKVCL
jgi:adenylosuccinate synthase